MVIGGNFTSYNGLEWSHLAIINADGSLDPSFGRSDFDSQGRLLGGSNFDVFSVAVQTVGGVEKILVSTGHRARFNCENCSAAPSRLMRLNLDGTIDPTFNPGGAGPAGGVSFNNITAIQEQSNGRLLIAGDFTSYNGTATAGVAVLNADGTLATAAPSISGGINPTHAMATSSGVVYYGPGCTGSLNGCATGGSYSLRSASLATPATVVMGRSFGTSSAINNFTPTTDGGMVVVGEFGSGFAGACIGKLDSAGALVTGFNSTTAGAGEFVATCDSTEGGLSAAVEDGNKNIIFGGYFGGAFQLARFNEAGTDLTVMAQLTARPAVLATQTVGATGFVIAGGEFSGADGKLIRYNIATGAIDTTFPAANGAYMTALAYQNADASPVSSVRAAVGTAVTISPVSTPSSGIGSVTYSLSNSSTLPGGLSLDPATGVISGTSTTAGINHVYIAASSRISRVTAYVMFDFSTASAGSGGGPRPTTTTSTTIATTTTSGASSGSSATSGSATSPQDKSTSGDMFANAVPGITRTDTRVYTTPPVQVAANSAISVLTPSQSKIMDVETRTPEVCLPNDTELVFLDEGLCVSSVVNAKTRKVLRTLRTTVVRESISKLRVGNAIATIAPIYFDAVSSRLDGAARQRIKRIRGRVAAAGSVLVVGHSGTLNGNSRANVELSRQRSANVISALRRVGAKGPFALVPAGASDPVTTKKTQVAQAKNRRVLIVLVP
jgi:outer membrane protein OmpA-like peptidoglycan-associated protein